MRALATVVLLALASSGARADTIDDVRRLEASLEYERALVLADQIMTHGGLDDRSLALLHFEAGKLAAGLDHPDAAQDHFARALAIIPSLSLPPGTSPKIVAPFEAARTQPHALHVDHHRNQVEVTVTAAPDPLHLVASVQVRVLDVTGQREELSTHDGPPFTVRLPIQARQLEVRAFDEHGNLLYFARDLEDGASDFHGPVVVGAAPPWYTTPMLWVVAGVGAIPVFGGFAAWRENVAQDEWNRLRNDSAPHPYSELRAVEDRGRNWALAANVSLGIAGAAALIAGLWWITDRSGSHSGDVIGLTAGPGTVGVAGRF